MGIKHESQASDEQAAGPDGNSAATAITAKAPSTRRTALGVTAAATAAFLADKALLAPGAARASGEVVESINGKTGKVTLGASEVGAIAEAEKGAASGVAELDSGGHLPEGELPASLRPIMAHQSLAIGENALVAPREAFGNTAIGFEALRHVEGGGEGAKETGGFNIAIGNVAGASITTGKGNICIGADCATSLTTGIENLAIGAEALTEQTTGSESFAIGNRALRDNTTGKNNLAIGFNALALNTTGSENLAVGTYALLENHVGKQNLAVGYQAMFEATGSNNLAIGANSLRHLTTGAENMAIGCLALANLTTGNENIAIGEVALEELESGKANIAIGWGAGRENKSGEGNLFIGQAAGYSELGSNTLYIANSGTSEPLIKGVFPNVELALNASKIGFNKKPPVTLIGESLSTGKLEVAKGEYGFKSKAQAEAAAKFIELFSKWAHESGLTA